MISSHRILCTVLCSRRPSFPIEWLYIISGHARATAFAGSSSSRTFDFQVSSYWLCRCRLSADAAVQPGDTAVFPTSYGHYVKNLSPTEPLIYLELFRAPKFVGFSATQW